MDFMTAKGERNKTAKMTAIALMTAAALRAGAVFNSGSHEPGSHQPDQSGDLFYGVCAGGRGGARAACGLYLLLGAVGMPVFGGFSGGLGTLLGPHRRISDRLFVPGGNCRVPLLSCFRKSARGAGIRHDPGNRRFVPCLGRFGWQDSCTLALERRLWPG